MMVETLIFYFIMIGYNEILTKEEDLSLPLSIDKLFIAPF